MSYARDPLDTDFGPEPDEEQATLHETHGLPEWIPTPDALRANVAATLAEYRRQGLL